MTARMQFYKDKTLEPLVSGHVEGYFIPLVYFTIIIHVSESIWKKKYFLEKKRIMNVTILKMR